MPLSLEQLQPLMPEMSAWALRSHPEEACGLVVERRGALMVICCDNLQNERHAADPIAFPSTARSSYYLSGLELVAAEEGGGRVRAVFHSHPDRGAYFSDEDLRHALGGGIDGEPVLPGVDYLVLSTRESRVEDARLFVWSENMRNFVEPHTP